MVTTIVQIKSDSRIVINCACLNAELSRSRWALRVDETRKQRTSRRDRKQQERRLSAPAIWTVQVASVES
jgi:hypothetical protein